MSALLWTILSSSCAGLGLFPGPAISERKKDEKENCSLKILWFQTLAYWSTQLTKSNSGPCDSHDCSCAAIKESSLQVHYSSLAGHYLLASFYYILLLYYWFTYYCCLCKYITKSKHCSCVHYKSSFPKVEGPQTKDNNKHTHPTVSISNGPLNDVVHDWNSFFTGSLWKMKEGLDYIQLASLDFCSLLTEKISVLLTFRSFGWWWVQASSMAANRSPVPTNTASTLGMSMQIFWLLLVPSSFTTVRTDRVVMLKLTGTIV